MPVLVCGTTRADDADAAINLGTRYFSTVGDTIRLGHVLRLWHDDVAHNDVAGGCHLVSIVITNREVDGIGA